MQIAGARAIYHASTGERVTRVSDVQDIEDLIVEEDMTARMIPDGLSTPGASPMRTPSGRNARTPAICNRAHTADVNSSHVARSSTPNARFRRAARDDVDDDASSLSVCFSDTNTTRLLSIPCGNTSQSSRDCVVPPTDLSRAHAACARVRRVRAKVMRGCARACVEARVRASLRVRASPTAAVRRGKHRQQ